MFANHHWGQEHLLHSYIQGQWVGSTFAHKSHSGSFCCCITLIFKLLSHNMNSKQWQYVSLIFPLSPLPSQSTRTFFHLLEHHRVHHSQSSNGCLHNLPIVVQQWNHVVEQVSGGGGLVGVFAVWLVIQWHTEHDKDRKQQSLVNHLDIHRLIK